MNLALSVAVNAQYPLVPANLKTDRTVHQFILKTIKDAVVKNYYDPKLRGVDFEASVRNASELIDKAQTIEEMDEIIARVLYAFKDPNLDYIPPPRIFNVRYGWNMQYFGDKLLVTDVDRESDAYKKGLRRGDQIYMIEDYLENRNEFWMFQHHLYRVRPVQVVRAIIIKPNGAKYKVELAAKVTRENVFLPRSRDFEIEEQNRYARSTKQSYDDETLNGIAVWRIPTFELTETKIDKMMDGVMKSTSLILDLRGNYGGYIDPAKYLAARFFRDDTVFCELRGRKKSDKISLKGRGKKAYAGKMVVLIDSDSSYESELIARLLQIEKRATVVGDRSSGKVTETRFYVEWFGLSDSIPFGVYVPVVEILMSDGQRVDGVGVIPDVVVNPTGADLAAGRDPVLARAAEVLGQKLTPEDAGKMFKSK